MPIDIAKPVSAADRARLRRAAAEAPVNVILNPTEDHDFYAMDY